MKRQSTLVAWMIPVVMACGCGAEPERTETARATVGQVVEVATKVAERAGEISDEWPFTWRQVDAMRVTSRTENLEQGTYIERVVEYVRPDLMREVEGKEPTVAERFHDSEHTYLRIGEKLITAPSSQGTKDRIEQALRVNTSLEQLEKAHKFRQLMHRRESVEELDGTEMIVFVLFQGEKVKVVQRTWVGADDGLVYKIEREIKSEKAHERSTTAYEYGAGVTIEIPQE